MKDLNDYDSNDENQDDNVDDRKQRSKSTIDKDALKLELELRKQLGDKRSIHLH